MKWDFNQLLYNVQSVNKQLYESQQLCSIKLPRTCVMSLCFNIQLSVTHAYPLFGNVLPEVKLATCL